MLHAVPESLLAPDVAGRLPAEVPGAPWTVRAEAIVWACRATDAAVGALPEPLRGRRRLPLTVAAFVRYLDTPVGPYHEVLAAPVVSLDRPLPAATVPFIAVDSLASIAGGRRNWLLPKTFAAFRWAPGSVSAEGDGWTVAARVTDAGPRLPLPALALNRQVDEQGRERTTVVRGRALGRPARVQVDVTGPGLGGWLRPGRHPALVLSRARLRVGAPR